METASLVTKPRYRTAADQRSDRPVLIAAMQPTKAAGGTHSRKRTSTQWTVGRINGRGR